MCLGAEGRKALCERQKTEEFEDCSVGFDCRQEDWHNKILVENEAFEFYCKGEAVWVKDDTFRMWLWGLCVKVALAVINFFSL